jgi:MFS superfamily sulfate permease-like transporter
MKGVNFGQEAIASIVVFLVALPLCMGIAIASGVPPALGLITGIVGGLVVGFLAGSPLQVSGPAAGLAVIVWELVTSHGIVMLGTIVLIGGAIQLAAGLLKWGRYFRAIAPPVIYGMLAGIGVLIFAAQFHVMLDDKPQGSGIVNLLTIPESILKGIFPVDGSSHHIAAMVGLLTILSIVVWTKFRPQKLKSLPGPLVAVVVATTAAAAFRMPIKYVDVPANLLDVITLPTVGTLTEAFSTPAILGAALAMALIASAETLLCAVAVDRMHEGPRTNFDRELAAQGIGNMLCGVLGALPMTGVIVRSSANVEAGAKTRASAILHGVWLLAFVVALPFVLRMIPTASLAAILVYTGYKLVNPANVRTLASYGRVPVMIYAATLIGIVTTNLLTGVLIGVGLSITRLIYNVSHLDLRLETKDSRADLYLDGSATFVGLPKLAAALDEVPAGTELHVHVDKLTHIDHACLDALHNWEKQGEKSGSTLTMEWDDVALKYERTSKTPSSLQRVTSEPVS